MKKIITYNSTKEEFLGIITFNSRALYDRSQYILITEKPTFNDLGYMACIATQKCTNVFLPFTLNIAHQDMPELSEGDIVRISQNEISILWSANSCDNVLFLTESCNCRCIMCPQPYKKHDKRLVKHCEKILDLLKNKEVSSICITGGEPTVLGDVFIKILRRCVTEHPEAEISILTNGKSFAKESFAKEAVRVASNKTIFCISLHADYDKLHDTIVGIQNSHNETENGIYNLAQYGANIELRYVITKLNYKRMFAFAEYVYHYFPFCCHYTFMGMELYADAVKNKESIYSSPHEYKEELRQAVLSLYYKGLPVSVYNIPFCLCHRDIHSFARQSISGWKNIFLPQCDICLLQKNCAGFFATSESLPVQFIQPITSTEEI